MYFRRGVVILFIITLIVFLKTWYDDGVLDPPAPTQSSTPERP